ncbi:MAG: hypothetical protein FD123_2259 [Bacteroidetes bacterium]|nr:MAG: hypothetical protein FD123_2259 [Bacteroidota bacterium]
MHLFYVPGITGETCTLSEEESKHAVRVLRLANGDAVQVIDGKGGFFNAVVSDNHPKRCVLALSGKIPAGKHPYNLHLAIGPTKNIDRMEWLVEKATEIGIDSISPVDCRYSERTVIKKERLEKIAVSAMKQSLKAWLPQVEEICPFHDFIAAHQNSGGQKFIAHCHDTPKENLQDVYIKGSDVLILIGPEGDFSEDEVALAVRAGFVPVSLGRSRLRTETAGLVAVMTVALGNA